jgi:hypothetical protein
MKILGRYGVEGETPDVRRAALRCVANALLLDEKMRQIFVDTGYGNKLAEILKVCRIPTKFPAKLRQGFPVR